MGSALLHLGGEAAPVRVVVVGVGGSEPLGLAGGMEGDPAEIGLLGRGSAHEVHFDFLAVPHCDKVGVQVVIVLGLAVPPETLPAVFRKSLLLSSSSFSDP